jgi:hypothetical protein
MSATARKFPIQKIRRIGWHILGVCCFVLAPLSISFAATKPAAAKAANAVTARYRHNSFGFGVFGIMGYPYPPSRPTIYAAPPAMVYIEKDATHDNPPEYVWYYCRSLQTYYPYILDCPEIWEEVKPTANAENNPANSK